MKSKGKVSMDGGVSPKTNRPLRWTLGVVALLITGIAGFLVGAGLATTAWVYMSLQNDELTLIGNYSNLRDCKRHPCDVGMQTQLVQQNDVAINHYADWEGMLSGNIFEWYLGSAAIAAAFPTYARQDVRAIAALKAPYEKLGCGLQGVLCKP